MGWHTFPWKDIVGPVLFGIVGIVFAKTAGRNGLWQGIGFLMMLGGFGMAAVLFTADEDVWQTARADYLRGDTKVVEGTVGNSNLRRTSVASASPSPWARSHLSTTPAVPRRASPMRRCVAARFAAARSCAFTISKDASSASISSRELESRALMPRAKRKRSKGASCARSPTTLE
jgi:hypothetical protein